MFDLNSWAVVRGATEVMTESLELYKLDPERTSHRATSGRVPEMVPLVAWVVPSSPFFNRLLLLSVVALCKRGGGPDFVDFVVNLECRVDSVIYISQMGANRRSSYYLEELLR